MSSSTKLANPQHPDTKLSPAERAAKLLAFKRGNSHNFTLTRVATQLVPVASSKFASV